MRRLFRALTLAVVLTVPAAAAANPFLGSDGAAPAPIVRAPGSAGSAKLAALQIAFRNRVADLLSSFKSKPRLSAAAGVLAAAFLYGILHAAGPGHRKTVVFSLFVSRKAAPWEPLAAGFLSALVHAATGVTVVLILGLIRGAVTPLADADRTGAYLEAGTFIALVVLASLLSLRKIAMIARGKTLGRERSGGAPGKLGLYGIVVVTSVVPCPGAVIMLLFALYLDLTALGVAGVAAMSFGMGIVVSAAGYLAYFGRSGLFSRLKGRERAVAVVADLMELCSYLIVLAFSLFMAWPFLTGY